MFCANEDKAYNGNTLPDNNEAVNGKDLLPVHDAVIRDDLQTHLLKFFKIIWK